MEINKIYKGDCLDVIKTFEDNSIDSIVTDPPYELGFMGKKWDNSGIAYNIDLWKECLRVLKPGGHLLSFSGTRTYHRMAVAIEDAGFEVRDMIEWCYGSGFPKSLNIGKAVDKIQGNERESLGKYVAPDGKERGGVANNPMDISNYQKGDRSEHNLTKGTSEWEGWGTALKPAHEPICLARKPLSEKTVAENCLKHGTGGINIDESRVEGILECDPNRFSKTDGGNFNTSLSLDNHTEPVVRNEGRFPANLIHDNSEEVRECFPESKSSTGKRGGQGFHNAFGRPDRPRLDGQDISGHNDSGNASRFFKSIQEDGECKYCNGIGCIACSALELNKSIIYQAKASKSERNKGCDELETSKKFTAGNYSQSPTCKTCDLTLNGTNDHSECSGEVYYKEMESKNTKNNHPTVKPIALMSYLIKMITPKGGIVLDPFAGSGSTLVAAKENNFNFIGIELTEEYIPIIEARTGAEIFK